MTATAQAQANIDTLKGKLDNFEAQLLTLKADIEEKRTAAGEEMLQDRNTERLEDEILRLESRLRTVETGKATAVKKLSEATAALDTARKADAQERMKAIRQEIDRVATDLEKNLTRAKESAEVFTGLLSEARGIHSAVNVPLLPLGSWVNISPPYDAASRVDSMLSFVLERIKQHKPKE